MRLEVWRCTGLLPTFRFLTATGLLISSVILTIGCSSRLLTITGLLMTGCCSSRLLGSFPRPLRLLTTAAEISVIPLTREDLCLRAVNSYLWNMFPDARPRPSPSIQMGFYYCRHPHAYPGCREYGLSVNMQHARLMDTTTSLQVAGTISPFRHPIPLS